MKAFRAFRSIGALMTGKGDPQARTVALRACVQFCLRPEVFPEFATWAASRPPGSFGWTDPAQLREDVVSGDALIEMAEGLMPLVMKEVERHERAQGEGATGAGEAPERTERGAGGGLPEDAGRADRGTVGPAAGAVPGAPER